MPHEVEHMAFVIEERAAERCQGWAFRGDDLDAGRGAHGFPEVAQLAIEIERPFIPWLGGHGEDAEGSGPAHGFHGPRHGQVADDGALRAEGREFRRARLTDQLPRKRLDRGEARIVRIEHELQTQAGLGISVQSLEASFIEVPHLSAEQGCIEPFSERCRRQLRSLVVFGGKMAAARGGPLERGVKRDYLSRREIERKLLLPLPLGR